MKRHFINLNLYYWLPIWKYRVPLIYSKMNGWIEGTNYWFSSNREKTHVAASLEPSGLCISALMDDDEWDKWITQFKKISQEILGYKIGEIELGEVGHEPEWIKPELKVLNEIKLIIDSKSPDMAWKYLDEIDKDALTEVEEIEIAKDFFQMNWHEMHDQLASAFQWSKHPTLSKFLFKQVSSGSIPEFEYKPVSRKATWALADIGTKESKEYLNRLANHEDINVQRFAVDRINNWNKEKDRKGRMIPSNLSIRRRIRLEKYSDYKVRIPISGYNIIAYHTDDQIVLYQAYNKSIADYAIKNQRLGGPSYSYNRMSWVKPNYLWMMYRSGWATKVNQERILAIRILRSDWESILEKSVLSSYDESIYGNRENWQNALKHSEVRIQWDPDHDPYGNKLERKAIQIGMKGDTLKDFGQGMIKSIEDITSFVRKQSLYVELGDLKNLEIPKEEIYDSQNLNVKTINF